MLTRALIDLHREYTAEELLTLPDDGNRYELIEGNLFMTPPPMAEHGDISDELLTELKNFLRLNPNLGRVWSHVGFNIGKKPNGKDNVLEPDLGFIIAERVPSNTLAYLPYPDLAVEVWSRQSDLADSDKLQKARQKLHLYLRAGTRLAWGINPIRQEVEVYHRGQTGPVQILDIDQELDGEDIIPGFKLPARSLFQ